MLRYYGIIRASAKRLSEAIDHTVEAFHQGRIQQEPAFTDRMLGSIEESLRDFQVKGVTWSAKTLTDRGSGSQESRYGADFMGVLNIDLPDFKVKKGFLAQAKIIRPGLNLDDLQRQCEKMLTLSPDSFVFLYSISDVVVVPAISVVSANAQPTDLYSRTVARFFEEHFESFIGDRNISAPIPDTLENLRERYEARSLLFLQAASEFSEEFRAQ